MQWCAIGRMMGFCWMVFSCFMLTPVVIAYIYLEPHVMPFMLAGSYAFLAGFVLVWLGRRHRHTDLRVDDGFLLIALLWSSLSMFAALPFITHPDVNMSVYDALFEAVSGFTTTGASVVPSVDALPRSVLYYRQQLHFLGGMGILLMAVAILPTLGVGGLGVYQSELPGPIKDQKIAPRVKEAARILWQMYALLTMCCILCYYLGGMHWFDAVGEGFSTVATGGFCMHDASFAHYPQGSIKVIAMIFMLLSGSNYMLHYTAVYRGNWPAYFYNEEWRYFIAVVVLASVIVALVSFSCSRDLDLLDIVFTVVSLATTTGFITDYFPVWPSVIPILLMLVALVGCCSGSTGGGIKILRLLLVKKQIQSELNRVVHPQAVVPVKFIGIDVTPSVVQSMWAFLAAFISMLWLLVLALIMGGLDLESALGTAIASLANAGAGIGEIASGYHRLSDINKMWCVLAMVAGRLEIFTLWVILCPAFWQR